MPLAQVRLSPSLKSGFANLPQAWVNALWDTRKDLKDVVLELSWTPAPTDSGDAKRNTAYVGWGGKSSAGAASLPPLLKSEAAASASTVAHQIIELDSFYGRGLGLQDGQKVGRLAWGFSRSPADWKTVSRSRSSLSRTRSGERPSTWNRPARTTGKFWNCRPSTWRNSF